MKQILILVSLCIALTGCSTIERWFADEEELKIRELQPIDAQFTPQVNWQRYIGDGVQNYYSSLQPVSAYDKVFAASRDGIVLALDPESGKVIWEQDLAENNSNWFARLTGIWEDRKSARLSSGLTAVYDKVYLGSEHGYVIALDQQTGEQVWKMDVKGEVMGLPAVDEGFAVVNTSAGHTIALDAETGEKLWQHEGEVPPLSLRGLSSPVIAAGGVLTGTATGKVSVMLSNNGQVAWEQVVASPTGATELDRLADIDTQPVILNGVIYVISYDGTLAALELRSGRVIWKREYSSYVQLTYSGNNLYVVDVNSVVYALDRRNGVELWSQSSLRQRQLSAATPVGDYLVVGDKWGFVHWLNLEDGAVVARLDLGGDDEDEAIYTAPMIEGENIIIQTREGLVASIKRP